MKNDVDRGCDRCGKKYGWFKIFNICDPDETRLCIECCDLIYTIPDQRIVETAKGELKEGKFKIL
jgi:hypothetical protein